MSLDETQELIRRTLTALEEFLDNALSCSAFVSQFDSLMADNRPHDDSSPVFEILDEFHLKVAHYVDDAVTRLEHPAYFGPDQLRRYVLGFRPRLLEYLH